LTNRFREIAGTPVLYIKYISILLDRVSELTKAQMATNAADEIEKVGSLCEFDELNSGERTTKGSAWRGAGETKEEEDEGSKSAELQEEEAQGDGGSDADGREDDRRQATSTEEGQGEDRRSGSS